MEAYELYNKYKRAKERFQEEKAAIAKEYISSHYSFKEGDIVKIQNIFYKEPTLIVLDSVYIGYNPEYSTEENAYRNPKVSISGHMVDEEGYDITYFPNSTQTIGVGAKADDVIEVTNIRPKGLR